MSQAKSSSSECVCGHPQALEGAEARDYLEHLHELSVDTERWLETFECPRTGRRWLADYPQSEQQGGGPIRLRTFDQVYHDVKLELNAIHALVEDAAAELADRLTDALGDCWYPPTLDSPPA